MIILNFATQKAEDDFKTLLKPLYPDIVYTEIAPMVIPELKPVVPTLFLNDFTGKPNGLITNEYAFWNPTDAKSKISPDWSMDSGSLFIKDGFGWSGVPDSKDVDALSATGNNSSIFRLTTKRKDFKDVSVKVKLKTHLLGSTTITPPVDWDGLHIFLRYQSEYNLYYASINRRDNTCVIKKKIPGGPSNDGTYYELSAYVPHKWTPDLLQNVEATIKTQTSGAVLIVLSCDGVEIVRAIDNGSVGGSPIISAGAVGIRGDNVDFTFNPFSVSAI